MSDLLLTFGISNLCLSVALALVAWVVQRGGRHPLLAHLLWVLVLVKLVTPPVLTLPLIAVPTPSMPAQEAPAPSDGAISAWISADRMDLDPGATGGEELRPVAASSWLQRSTSGLTLVWLLGSAGVLVFSLLRIHRFHRLLGVASKPAPRALQEIASRLARRLGLRGVPSICTTAANISPMVWWTGGKVRVLVPASLPGEMDAEELRWILAHELAHVRRRDHLVRWLEWLACVCFWWNPVVWWARRSLRATEEVCCDALVLSRLRPDPHSYASSLLNAVELIAFPALRPPAVASEMNSGGFLERRLRMITSKKPLPATPRWLLSAVLVLGAGVLPLSVAYAQDFNAVERRLGAAVEAGEITLDQARAMMDALRRVADDGVDSRRDLEGRKLRYSMLERRVKAAVERGELSEEEAERKLIEAREEMFGNRRGEERDEAALRMHYHGLEQRVKAAVERGELSEEGAERKLIEAREELFGNRRGEERDEAALRMHYHGLEQRVKAAVERGELSEEGAERKLIEAREELFGNRRGEERDEAALRMHYHGLEQRVKAAVERGELSEEEAEKKLIEARKELFGEPRGREEEDPIRHRVGEVLGEFDEDGDGTLTKAEAGDFWARISDADGDRDGKVTAKEMYVAWGGEPRGGGDDLRKLVDELLARFDRDKDGAITEAEAGERWPRIATADADKDGKVTAREMLGSWR